jgi:hypothetical protein
MTTFTPGRPMMPHQARAFERFKDEQYWALFWEQRVRKTKVVYDITCYRYLLNQLNALLIVSAPNGVNRVWRDEAEKDIPANIPSTVLVWETGKAGTKWFKEKAAELLVFNGLAVLSVHCDTLTTDRGWKYIEKFLAKRRAAIVGDEASFAANWSARTQRFLALGRRPAVFRAILDGTPAAEGPNDLYHPTNFLLPGLLGFRDKAIFKEFYTAYEEETVEVDGVEITRRVKGTNYRQGKIVDGEWKPQEYDIVQGYRNLDHLERRLARFGDRVRRRDVSNAPEPTYQFRYFELTPRQRAVYDRLRDEYVAELSRGEVTVGEVLRRMCRLQMAARNYYPPERQGKTCPTCAGSGALLGEDCPTCEGIGIAVAWTELERIDKTSPALDAMEQELRASRGPAVVWCCYRQDVTDALERVRALGRTALRYDGSLPNATCEANYLAFKAGEVDTIVATGSSGLSRGHDLTRAETLIFYSNSFKLRDRLQDEDRAESLDRTFSTGIVDIVAADTRDVDVINALRAKRSVAELIQGDPASKWL